MLKAWKQYHALCAECVCRVCVCVREYFSNEFAQSLMRKTEVCHRSFPFCFSSPVLSETTGWGGAELGNLPQNVFQLLLDNFTLQEKKNSSSRWGNKEKQKKKNRDDGDKEQIDEKEQFVPVVQANQTQTGSSSQHSSCQHLFFSLFPHPRLRMNSRMLLFLRCFLQHVN